MILTCVVTHDRLPLTKRTIESYLDTVGPDFHLVVVDNASTDGTREWLETLSVQRILNDTNRFPGAACNQGWDAALHLCEPTLLHRSDNDIEYLPGWREEVERQFEAFPEIALLGILNLHEDGAPVGDGIEIVPRVGGNVVMPTRHFRAGLRWEERPWRYGVTEDGLMCELARHYGWIARLRRTVANNMAFGRAHDFPAYYQETARIRGISNWERSV